MSNPNFDTRYAKTTDVAAAIAAQAVTDAGQYGLSGLMARRGTFTPVATRTSLTYMRTLSDGTNTQETSRVSHIVTAQCANLRIYYANISSNNNGVSPTDGPNSITVRMDLESADGKRKRGWTTTGSRSLTIEPGGIGYFTVQGSYSKGDRIYTRTNVSVASSGMKWPRGMTANTGAQSGIGEGVTTGSDLTLPSTTAVTTSFIYVYSPAMILGETTSPVPTFAQIGDSIIASQADDADLGFFLRALNNNYGYVNLAQQGERIDMYLSSDEGGTRAMGLDHVTHALCEYGVNDIFNNGSSTLSTVQANALLMWTQLAKRGISVYQTTITPKSSSTDSWATLANQTVDPQTSVRNNYNDWIRDGSPIDSTTKNAVAVGTPGALRANQTGHPLKGWFEVTDSIESARNSGLWKVDASANYATADGTHPSKAAHILMATAINVSQISLK